MNLILIDPSMLIGGLLQSGLAEDNWQTTHLCGEPNHLERLSLPTETADVVILRSEYPLLNCARFVPIISTAYPTAKIIIIGPANNHTEALSALRAGVSGYVSVDKPITSLKAAILFVTSGEQFITPSVMEASSVSTAYQLTIRELQMIVGISLGQSNKEIGKNLGLTEPTIKLHIKNVMRKINARNRAHVVSIALLNGVLPTEFYNQIQNLTVRCV